MGTPQDFSTVHTRAKDFVKLLCDGIVLSVSPFIPSSSFVSSDSGRPPTSDVFEEMNHDSFDSLF